MIGMPTINSIRQLRRDGRSITDIANKTGVSRDTVYKYLKKDDFSPKAPTKIAHPSKLDPYRKIIESWIDEDKVNWRKQRHTYRRIFQRLREEFDLDVSESAVNRYVRKLKETHKTQADGYLDLDWAPGEAQADFGEADFYMRGTRMRMHYFVLSFPYSNVGFAQVLPGENAECVCTGLKTIFEYAGGVPMRIVFDNATGIGRRVCDQVRTTELFGAFAAHYDFSYTFCNPASGNEKGNVENKVGFIRRNIFTPPCNVHNIDIFNRRLLDKCIALADKPHWCKGEMESQLFMEDAFAMAGLPAKPFDPVSYVFVRANKQGKVCLGGCHHYSTDPSLAGCRLMIGLRAFTISIYTEDGEFICEHARAYGSAPTDTSDPASQLPLLCIKSGAWKNSKVRTSLSEKLREYLDSLDPADLKAGLRLLRDECARSGWEATSKAAELAFKATGRIDAASIGVGASRIASGIDAIAYDDPVDLGIYDSVFDMREN